MNMWQTIKKYPTALIWAIVVHVLAFVAIGVSFHASEPTLSAVKEEKVIAAVAIDETQVNAEINKLKKAQQQKAQQQKRLQDDARKAKNERRKEEKRIRAIKKEQQKQAQILKKEQQKQAQILKKQQQAKEKRLAELEKKTQEQERKQKEKEKELSRLEKQAKEKQAQLEKEEKERAEKIAQKKKAEEEQRRVAHEQSEIAKFKSLIKDEITRKWIFPASYQKGMKCKVLVRLIPSGDVVSVQVIESSGNSAFDRSVEMAVNKASPLPVPKAETDLFKNFREVEFVFDPNA